MVPVIAILQALGPYTWFIIGAVLLIAETLLPGVSLIWFGIAASLTGAVLLAVPLGWETQMIIFIAFSIVTVLAGRLIAARRERDGADRVNLGASGMIGRELALAEPIVNGYGRAAWGDGLWRVAGPDVPAGRRVRVVGIEAATLLVEPVNEEAEIPAPSPAAVGRHRLRR